MFTVEQLLTIAKEKKASDVHVTVGLPPRVRINGELVDLEYPKLTPADCEKLILDIMDERQENLFKDRGELDFSFPRDDIAKLSGMTMPVNKRNWLKQNQHLYLARRRKEDMKAVRKSTNWICIAQLSH